ASADGIEKVLPEFMEFIGDATLVAHNAKFDIGFVKRDVKKYLGYDYNPSVIDTLQWARDLMPDLNGHGLKTVTKKLGVALENHHRAVDDSQATAQMFAVFLDMMKAKGATTLDKLDGIFPINTGKQAIHNVMLLAQNVTGLQNIYRLVSEAHLVHYGTKKPRITRTLIKKYREGILVGAPSSMHFANEGELISEYLRYNMDSLEEKVKFYDYIEMQPRETYNELVEADATGTMSSLDKVVEINKYFYNLAKENGKIVVGTSNVHYLNEEEAKVRSILLYGSGSVFRENQYMADNKYYFRTTDELLREFSYFGDEIAREIVIENTNKINEMIEKVQPVPSGFYPPKIDNADSICREMTYAKAYELYGNPLPEVIEQRLERELKAIIGNGFAVLYLSAQKLVKESLDNGYLVGSRGSVGSSLVAYMMGITEVNALYPHYICQNKDCFHIEFIEREGAGVDLPEKVCEKCGSPTVREGHTIPFEVFMGFDGDKVPDIDLNFSGEYQEKIHRYCEELFGKENVFKAGTISTLAEKNAYGYVKKFFEEHSLKSKNAELVRLAKYVEGAKKTTGQHPGGMIVVPQGNSIYEFCPVQRPANDMKNPSITTHFDYHVMDEQLVKLDILGHDDPTTIKLLQELTGVDIYTVPLGDRETLKLFSSTESLNVTPDDIGSVVGSYGVPEFGTPFVRQMLVDTKPTTFAELVRISGLSHGTDVWLNNAQEFIKQGKATLSEIISVRDDIMNFLIDSGIEKVTAFKIMEFVRKGMPSKNAEQWENYSQLMKEHKVPDWYIESCRRIKYMFPKGHAVAYVTMAMRIAYFKVHYPLAFYAAYLSRKAEDFNSDLMLASLEDIKKHREGLAAQQKLDVKEKGELSLCEIIGEMHARGFEFLGIDVYKSDGFKFTIEDGKIRIPLIGINGLGASVVENIVKERELGKFISYEDLKRRTKTSGTVLEKLKSVNAIEGLSETNQISLF
ncbi:MAG: PolC-type DNA polymerase III, partial [Fusobacteriaceae bacterium]|nr:PolC-type DNA polymerase III [Fusobacteriaceae bacterium]